ncbi:FmdB family zinc ribbon protein [Caballeronia terrestris]|jgi:putative FmdB family regulatory protein|uniref:FmdB family zinc ribbon protein n=1 Tax=Caballeronia terrestris TaxID=1226301 RepID=UPI000B300EFF|nr:zinc ribbon domain-containing protein [Caballeronia terrestris]
MPVYDYECAECGFFEATRRIAERDYPAICPNCHGAAARVVVGAPSLGGSATSASSDDSAGSYGMKHRGSCSCC